MSLLFRATAPFEPFTSLHRLAADKDGGGGGEGTLKVEADISTLPKAKARVAELEAEVTSLTNARDQAMQAQKDAEKARDQATEVATTVGKERDKAKADLLVKEGEVTTLTGERDQARKDLGSANTNVSRLEKLCGVKGIDPKDAPAAANDENTSSGAALYEQYESLTGADKTAFLRKNGPALTAYANSIQKSTR